MQINSMGAAYVSAPQYDLSGSRTQGAIPLFKDLITSSAGDDVAFSYTPSEQPSGPSLAKPFGSLTGLV